MQTQVITQSYLSTFDDCPEKARLAYHHSGTGIRPRVLSLRLATGTIIHGAVSALYKKTPFKIIIQNIITQYKLYVKSHHLSPDELQKVEIESACTVAGVTGYATLYAKEIAGQTKLRIMDHEIPIEWYLTTKGALGPVKYRMAGSIDMLGKIGKDMVLVETKTTSQISSQFMQDMEMSIQTIFYEVSAYEMYGGEKNGGANIQILFNYIRKPSIRPRKGEDLPAFMRRVAKDYLDRPEFYYHRAYVKRTPAEIIKFKQELLHTLNVNQFIQKTNQWYRNRRACNAKWRCEFFDICNKGERPDVMSAFKLKSRQHEELPPIKDVKEAKSSAVADEEE